VVLAAIGAGLVSLGLFAVVEARTPDPMLPLELFRSRTFLGTNLITLVVYAGLVGGLFFLPFNLIQVQGYSASAAGAAMLPFIVMMFLLSRWAGGLVARYGARLPLTVGPLLTAASSVLYALPGVGGSYWSTFFPAVMVQGIGMGITVAPLSTAVMGSVPVSHAGVASGINNAVSRIAGLLAIAIMGVVALVVFNASMNARLAQLDLPPETVAAVDAQRTRLAGIEIPPEVAPDPGAGLRRAVDESFVAAFRVVMLSAGALAFCGALVAWLLIEPRPRTTAP
jgi:predicted MFS family arabinose efflux permease